MELADQHAVEMARDTASTILRYKRAASTVKSYLQTYQRLVRAEQNPIEYCSGSTKGVYYAIKAGYQYGLAAEIKTQVDAWFTSRGAPEAQAQTLMKINELMAKLRCSSPDYKKEHQYQGIERTFAPGRKKRSKRQVLGKLPANWRELVIAGAAPQHRAAITVLAACGCRPAELAKGVTIVKHQDGIGIVIKGAKITEYAGQKMRGLLLDPRVNQFARVFWDEMEEGHQVVIQANRWTLIDAVRVGAKRGGIARWKSVTPYCFRHQFAADTKADDGPVSEAMGHATDRCASNYGQHSQAKGRGGILGVKTSRPVKRSIGRGADQNVDAGPRMR